ncbi:MAG: heme-binding protein [Pseudomonadota bacterium]
MWEVVRMSGATVFVIAVVVVLVGLTVALYLLQDIEVPAYRVLRREGPVELRAYPAMVVAEVERQGSRRQAVQRGFHPLARYIFAANRPGPRIAMTAPVTQRRLAADRCGCDAACGGGATAHQGDGAGGWVVRFIMPAESRIDALPAPAAGDVRLTELPAMQRAAVRFAGIATDDVLSAREAALRAWLRERDLPADGSAEYAYYNDPITPGFLRRNEVIIEVGAASAALPPG